MSYEDHHYHRERERHCRSLAELAPDPEIRRRHEQLAELHASRAAMYDRAGSAGARELRA